MAVKSTYRVTFRCGHSGDVDLSRKPAVRRRAIAEYLATTRECDACAGGASEEWKAQQVAAREEFDLRAELPGLSGSDKQVSFGKRRRADLLRGAYDELVEGGDWTEEEFEAKILAPARQVVAARFWIEAAETRAMDLEEIIASAWEVPGYVCENVE